MNCADEVTGMGSTEDQSDLDKLAGIVRRMADRVTDAVTIMNNQLDHFDWKTPYDAKLREVLDPLADIHRGLYALATEIEEHEARGQADG